MMDSEAVPSRPAYPEESMQRGTLVIVAGGAIAAGLVAGLVAAFGASADGRSPEDAATGVHSTQDPHDVATYWTEERKRNATGG
jgi:hypothetical protein